MNSKPDGMKTLSVDRSSYEPAYVEVVRILSQEIAGGAYRAGVQLPSESQLRAWFGVSGMTVRRAINILVDRGIISASQGKGTFVRGLDMREAAFRSRERHDDIVLGPGLLRSACSRRPSWRPTSVWRVSWASSLARPGDLLAPPVSQPDGPVMYHREYMIYDPRQATPLRPSCRSRRWRVFSRGKTARGCAGAT